MSKLSFEASSSSSSSSSLVSSSSSSALTPSVLMIFLYAFVVLCCFSSSFSVCASSASANHNYEVGLSPDETKWGIKYYWKFDDCNKAKAKAIHKNDAVVVDYLTDSVEKKARMSNVRGVIEQARDRFGQANAALHLKKGSVMMPKQEYSSQDGSFSISVWIKVVEFVDWASFLVFPSHHGLHKGFFFILGQQSATVNVPWFVYKKQAISTIGLQKQAWQHLVFSASPDKLNFYVDGALAFSHDLVSPLIINSQGYLGGDFREDMKNISPNAVFDDLIFFNRALSSHEIEVVRKMN